MRSFGRDGSRASRKRRSEYAGSEIKLNIFSARSSAIVPKTRTRPARSSTIYRIIPVWKGKVSINTAYRVDPILQKARLSLLLKTNTVLITGGTGLLGRGMENT